METLSEYKARTGISYSHIARLCGVVPATISQIAAGPHTPSFDLAVKIEEATNGHVSRHTWFPPQPREIEITIGGLSA
jgi:DNA-binding transcriptional regulator YdaS (Cro superfamily)